MFRNNHLWTALFVNMALTGLSGAALLVAGSALAPAFGLPGPGWLHGVAGLYLGIAALQAVALHLRHRRLAGLLTGADLLYAATSVLVIVAWPQALSTTGKLSALVVAAGVAFLAVLQLVGLRRSAALDRAAVPVR